MQLDELKQWILADGYQLIVDLDKSHGSRLVDKITGKTYIDFCGGFGSNALGYNHAAINNSKFMEAARGALVNKISNSDFYTDEYVEFVKTFATVAMPEGYKHLFFIDGGALAVENALKAAFDWKIKKTGVPENDLKVIHFRNAFHGRTGYTMSMTNTDPNKVLNYPKFDWIRITNDEDVAVTQIISALYNYPKQIAAMIIEPIQCEGGDNHFSKEFLTVLQNICLKNDILFIIDEVQTGFFTSGKAWTFMHHDLKPDIVTFGKKSQQCGLFVGPRIGEVVDHVFAKSSRINSTFGGNLVDMVRCTYILKEILSSHLDINATNMGNYWLEQMANIKSDQLTNVRGRGLLLAFDLPDTDIRNKLIDVCYQNGLIVLPCGTNSIRLRPHLAVTKEDMDDAITIITKSFAELKN